MTKNIFKTEATFADALVRRLRKRKVANDGDVYVLDLRHAAFGNKTPRVLRHPDDAGWPFKGRATSNEGVAKTWVRENYAPHLYQKLLAERESPGSSARTVTEVAESYVVAKMEELGPDGLRSLNSRVSMLRRRVIPAFGALPIRGITKSQVRDLADAMMVSKVVDGKRVQCEAELGTKQNLGRAMGALWKHAFGDDPCPYRVQITDNSKKAARRRALFEGDFEALLTPKSGAMSPKELIRALAGALYYDTQIGDRPNLRTIMIPNTVYAIVIQVALGLRISELQYLRWRHIDWDRRIVVIMGTKTKSALRIVPLQERLVPWLLELKARQGGDPAPTSFVIRTNPRASELKPAALTTLSTRISWALKYAGLKVPKKATHWARATHATWASRELKTPDLKKYLGHAEPYGGATDVYIEEMVEMMPAKHRRYIKHLPSPGEVRDGLGAFQPMELKAWRERRKFQSRSKAAKEAQRLRAQAKQPLHARLVEGLQEPADPVASAFGFSR